MLGTAVVDTNNVGMNKTDKIHVLNTIYIYKKTK